MISIWKVKFSNLPQNSARLDQKWKEFWKFSRKLWDFLIKISSENWHFSQVFTTYFLTFLLLSESIYHWKITSDFYNNFPISRGGGNLPASPTPDASDIGGEHREGPHHRNGNNCWRNLLFFQKGLFWITSFPKLVKNSNYLLNFHKRFSNLFPENFKN